jgi:hypothetical protein
LNRLFQSGTGDLTSGTVLAPDAHLQRETG